MQSKMDLTESILETEYRDEGYSDHHNSIDAQSAIEFNCENVTLKCDTLDLNIRIWKSFFGAICG